MKTTNESDAKRQYILLELISYYKANPQFANEFKMFIGQSKKHKERPKNAVSMRLLDSLVTKLRTFQEPEMVKLYDSYRDNLRAFTKKFLDAFRRDKEVELPLPNGNVKTTVGQANFFRWVLEHNAHLLAKKYESRLRAMQYHPKTNSNIKKMPKNKSKKYKNKTNLQDFLYSHNVLTKNHNSKPRGWPKRHWFIRTWHRCLFELMHCT